MGTMRRVSPRTAVTAVFFLNGAVFSAWYARLPAIADDLGLGPGQLGLALLGAPLGLLAAQPVVGALVARRGSRTLLAAAPPAMLAVALPALAVDLPTLVLAVVAAGAANGALDIAMNAQGLTVERAAGRPLFSWLHAAFSFGALAGAAGGGLIGGLGVDPLPHLLLWGAAGAIVTLAVQPSLLPDRAEADPAARRLPRASRRLAALGAIAFCALLSEGSVFDWSSLYLARQAGASPAVAPLGLAAFSLTMGIGRLLADGLAGARGPRAVARAGGLTAALGLAVALLLAAPAPGIAGFAVMGLGLSAVFPLALRTAGESGVRAGPDLAAVSTAGYSGLLLGPPLIGLLAEAAGLRAALGIVCAACLLAALFARVLARAAPRAGPARAAGTSSV